MLKGVLKRVPFRVQRQRTKALLPDRFTLNQDTNNALFKTAVTYLKRDAD